MRLPFSSKAKRHLKYNSIGAWYEGERVPWPILKIEDKTLRDMYWQRYCELRHHLFLKSLPKREKGLIESGKHPSQGYHFAEAAKPYLEDFRKQLPPSEELYSVELGFFQGDRIGFVVLYKCSPGLIELWKKPMFYRGFEIKYGALDLKPPPPEDTGLVTYQLTQGGPKKVVRRS